MKIWRYLAAVILPVIILLSACSGQSSGNSRIGKPAPDFSTVSISGNPVSLSDFEGKPVLINFWAIRCPPCREEMPYIQQVFDEYAAQGLVILGVNNMESLGSVKPYIDNARYTYPVLLDTDGAAATKYGVYFLPASYFIDKDGIVRDVTVSPFTSKADIEKYLKKIMSL
jgi:peroxiredoxin